MDSMEWLPLALADLLAAWTGVKPGEILDRWGVPREQEEAIVAKSDEEIGDETIKWMERIGSRV